MKEQLISFETAKLAKERGFKWNTLDSFYKLTFEETWKPNLRDRLGNFIDWNTESYGVSKNITSRPTQSLLQKWLREVHNIDIQILRNKPGYSEYKVEIYKINNSNQYIYLLIKDEEFIKWFYTYEEALEVALQEALKLIEIAQKE